MRHPRVLSSQTAVLLIVDVQESFRKQLKDLDLLTRNITILAEAAKILKVPVILTEQYPKGLGKTIAEISACLGEHTFFEKNAFSCCQSGDFLEKLETFGRNQIIVCGIEAHVCIEQTVMELMAHNYQPHVVKDAIASRAERNKEIAWEKMVSSGAVPASVEMALYEMLVESGTEQFKSVQRLVK